MIDSIKIIVCNLFLSWPKAASIFNKISVSFGRTVPCLPKYSAGLELLSR